MEYFAAIAFFIALSAPTNADGSSEGLVYAPRHASVDYYAYPRYAFEYAVRDPHTGDNKAQWEKRDGDVVIGAYSLVEPDGSLGVVEYRADDKTGFNAVVKRIGPNIHPVATPIYKASIPSLGYKSNLQHPIGPVAGLENLASAPLYNGAYRGTATSGLLYKSIAPAILKEAAPISPIGKISEASISAPAPLYNAEIIPEPIYRQPILPNYNVPIPQVPVYKSPILQESYGLPILPPPILKQAPLLREPIYSSYLGRSGLGLPALKNLEPIGLGGIDYNLLGQRLFDYRRLIDNRAPLDYKGNSEYNAPWVYKGYSGPGLGYGH